MLKASLLCILVLQQIISSSAGSSSESSSEVAEPKNGTENAVQGNSTVKKCSPKVDVRKLIKKMQSLMKTSIKYDKKNPLQTKGYRIILKRKKMYYKIGKKELKKAERAEKECIPLEEDVIQNIDLAKGVTDAQYEARRKKSLETRVMDPEMEKAMEKNIDEDKAMKQLKTLKKKLKLLIKGKEVAQVPDDYPGQVDSDKLAFPILKEFLLRLLVDLDLKAKGKDVKKIKEINKTVEENKVVAK